MFMVKIEGISIEELHDKLKRGKVGKLVREIFGKDISIRISDLDNLYIREKKSTPKAFLVMHSYKDEFRLREEKYFDKTKELAEKYEQLFGTETSEVTIKLDYSK